MDAVTPAAAPSRSAAPADPLGVVRAYHQRTKHHLQRYAAGPQTLDWDAQPDAFRRWAGAPLQPLPLPAAARAEAGQPAWAELFAPGAVAPCSADLEAVGLLFELSFALSAWKRHGPDRWAVRVNPSSGNLHPTEAYLLAQGVAGLPDGLWHYAPREHALEQRAGCAAPAAGGARLWVGLSSIHWREAWKYGERALRYCLLDAGHALGALRYAAAVLGWRAQVVPVDDDALAALLGLDRDADFGDAEREAPEFLVALVPGAAAGTGPVPEAASWLAPPSWRGHANRLDRHPMVRWPVIGDAARALRRPPGAEAAPPQEPAPAPATPESAAAAAGAVDLIRRRRSAQRFDRRAVMPRAALERLVHALQPGALPWDVLPARARVHPVLFAHRVEGLAPGAYALARSAAGAALLRDALAALPCTPVAGLPGLLLLAENPALPGALRTIDCHQALGSDAMLAVAMLAEWDGALADAPWRYRELLAEAGLLGQVLYLEAEAAGLRGTGIGCFFDDALHDLLGLAGTALQSVYHFTVGAPVEDARIESDPPYAAGVEALA